MVKQEPVNINRQMILSVIPWANFYAFYRIQKLGMYIAIMLSVFLVVTSVIVGLIIVSIVQSNETIENPLNMHNDFMENWRSPLGNVLSYVISGGINLVLIRRWSKKWNEKFSDGSINEKTILSDKSSKKIFIGTCIGLILLFFVLMTIILPSTYTPNNGSITPDAEFGYFQHNEFIKYGGLKIMTTTFFTQPVDYSNPSDEYFFVGLQVYNNYFSQSVTYMTDEFILIDGNGNEYETVSYSSDESYDLTAFSEIPSKGSVQKILVFEIPYDLQMKYELQLGNIGLVCLQKCETN